MPKPLIGITMGCRFRDERPTHIFTLSKNYIDAVCAAGGIPILIAPDETHAKMMADKLDGLLLTGGGDIEPMLYGDNSHPEVHGVFAERDKSEIALLKMALHKKLPVFGICRGCQLINIVLGGTLHQHLPDVCEETCMHRVEPGLTHQHSVKLLHDSLAHTILETDEVAPVSWHHQAINQLGEGVIATAHAEDGIIEAIEYPDYTGWLLGVQWHAEHTGNNPEQQKLFDAFIEAAHTPYR